MAREPEHEPERNLPLEPEGPEDQERGTKLIRPENQSEVQTGPTSLQETEDVLVLLPEEEAVPVETEEVADSPWETEGRLGPERVPYSGTSADTEDLAAIGLKSVNPLAGTREISGLSEPISEELESEELVGGETENVGVIDEIAQLATGIDDEILQAGEGGTGQFAGMGEDGLDLEGSPEVGGGKVRGRSRVRFLVYTCLLAVCVGVAFYFYPELQDWGKAFFERESVVSARRRPSGGGNSGGEGPTSTNSGSVAGSSTSTGGGESSTTGTSSVNTVGQPERGLSPTRIMVREKVLLALELGLQWGTDQE